MCLGSLDLRNVRKIRSILNDCAEDLILNHRDILCKDPEKNFSRSCYFNPSRILSILLRFGAKNTESELIDLLNAAKKAWRGLLAISIPIVYRGCHARFFSSP